MKKLFTILAMVVMAIVAYSQAPQKLSYQAVIRNNSGQLVTNHTVGMKISILQGSASGTVVYSETYSPVPQTNANGLVILEIGGGTPVTGTFSSINWSSGTYYLKTEADPAGGTNYTVVGTSQLISVPYALHAKNAASYTETDPVFGAAPAKAITSGLITNWNTAFSWGNHAGLYKLVSYVPAWSEVTGKPTSVGGYGITDAVTLTGDQTIAGIKTFNSDLKVNGLNIGKGKNNLASNSAFGIETLDNNLTGHNNTAIGYRTLLGNTNGTYNTAIGSYALNVNIGGSYNTAVGMGTLSSNEYGYYNTALGAFNMGRNISGYKNTVVGYAALDLNETGNNNTAIGSYAGHANVLSENVFLGYMAGYWETGSNKLFIDNQQRTNEADGRIKALIYGVFDPSPANQYLNINGNTIINGIATVNGNTFVNGNLQVKNSAGPITANWWEFGTDTNNGTAIDFHSNSAPTDFSARIYRIPGDDGEFQIANTGNGNLAFYTAGTHRMSITVAGNVGIATTSPAYKLDVNGEITSRSATGNSFRLRVGRYSTFLRNDGSDFYILVTNKDDPDGSWNTLRPYAFNLSTGNTTIGAGALTVLHGGNVGIGTSAPGTKLAISGLTGSTTGSALIINGGNVYFLGSTRSSKDNIQPLNDDFSKILNANPVSFTDKNTGMKGIGYIAEEFEDAGLQNLLVYENGKLVSLRYDLISVYNLEIIKELQKHIESVEKENEILKSQVTELRADFNRLSKKQRSGTSLVK